MPAAPLRNRRRGALGCRYVLRGNRSSTGSLIFARERSSHQNQRRLYGQTLCPDTQQRVVRCPAGSRLELPPWPPFVGRLWHLCRRNRGEGVLGWPAETLCRRYFILSDARPTTLRCDPAGESGWISRALAAQFSFRNPCQPGFPAIAPSAMALRSARGSAASTRTFAPPGAPIRPRQPLSADPTTPAFRRGFGFSLGLLLRGPSARLVCCPCPQGRSRALRQL